MLIWDWFQLYGHTFQLVLMWDRLTAVMLMMVLAIALFINHYSLRYLQSDTQLTRFLWQLNGLVAAVILLIVSGNLLTAFIAWQWIGVGLYSLLNHYHYKTAANRAAKKKFMINRIGDLCFLSAVLLSIVTIGDSSYSALQSAAQAETTHAITGIILALIFVAVMTKSAQFPFHIWLIDTMEAPTPVSAIMHAGVINAGGLLLARLSGAYIHYPRLLALMLIVGLVTVIVGVFVKQQQVAVKRRLAFSTMSQMGYMVVQASVGCFASAVFHLIAHGFYKAYQFLDAGNPQQLPNNTIQQAYLSQQWPYCLSLLITLVMLGLTKIVFLRLSLDNQLNPLIWLFISITLWLTLKDLLMITKHVIIGVAFVALVYASYLGLLLSFSHFIEAVIVETSQTALGFTAVAVLMVIAFSSFAFIKTLPANIQESYRQWLKRLCINELSIEPLYRQYFLGPLRSFGDCLNKAKWKMVVGGILASLASVLVLFSGVQAHSLWVLKGGLLSVVFMIICLIVNRLKSFHGFILGQGLVFVIAGLLLFLVESGQQRSILFYFLFNQSIILLAAWLIIRAAQRSQKNRDIRANRLPISHLYIAVLLILLIGVPGTASFVAESALLINWLSSSVWITTNIAVGMILLTLTILHALQVHIFNPRTRIQGNGLPTGMHILFWLVVLMNLVNGLMPQFFIHASQRLAI